MYTYSYNIIYLNVAYYIDGPEIAAAESALAAVELGNVTLVCGANLVGHPAPNVQWRNSADVVIDPTNTNFVFNDGPEFVSLTIISAQLSDTGNWTCTLSSNETVVTVERMLPLTVISEYTCKISILRTHDYLPLYI